MQIERQPLTSMTDTSEASNHSLHCLAALINFLCSGAKRCINNFTESKQPSSASYKKVICHLPLLCTTKWLV